MSSSYTNGHDLAEARSSSSNSSDKRPGSTKDKRSTDPHTQASQIEKSVTHLLVATKQLLETLTQWSRGTANETEVSDVYVRLGYEFNIACRSFTSVGIDTSDLGPVPDTLRTILEETLSQEASQQSLDRFLPRIRDIIINLLHGLKRKQQKLRQKTGRDGSLSSTPSLRQPSVGSTASGSDNAHARASSRSSFIPPRVDSADAPQPPPSQPPAFSATTTASAESSPPASSVNRTSSVKDTADRLREQSSENDLASSYQTLEFPDAPPSSTPADDSPASSTLKPPPRESDALAQLQRGGELERRASRRFSAYQIQKHLGTSSIGMPSMPAQHSPIPNRGREARESVYASRTRAHVREKSHNNLSASSSPSRQPSVRTKSIDRGSVTTQTPSLTTPSHPPTQEDPVKNDQQHAPGAAGEPPASRMSASVSGPLDFDLPSIVPDASPVNQQGATEPGVDALPTPPVVSIEASADKSGLVDSEIERPASTGPLTLFLQYKKRVKKFVLAEGYADLTLASLQLAFIEKFAWNTHSNGVDLPEIYIQDPESGVRHELEDLNDVKDRTLLVLNTDDLDEVKRHFDDGLGSLKALVEGMKSSMSDNQLVLQRVSDRQQDAAKEMARISAAPPPSPSPSQPRTGIPTVATRGSSSQINEIQNLRRELAVLKQSYNSHMSDMDTAMSALRSKAAKVKEVAAQAAEPSLEGESGRTYVNAGKKQLQEDSEKIINRVDDLQDMVEDLRKDIATRGVRPLPRQLEAVSKDIAQATADLTQLREYMKKEKPIWKKVSEKELEAVMDDQNVLKLQEELAADLEDDLEKTAQTFALVEQASKQQPPSGARSASRTIGGSGELDPLKAKDGVLGEVKALQPNHESRLEAIERAEKARQRELQERQEGAFKRELGNFVEEGRLKKTGGFEEVERQRMANDDVAIREIWDRMGGKPVWEPPLPSELEIPTGPHVDSMPSPEPEFVEASEDPLKAEEGVGA